MATWSGLEYYLTPLLERPFSPLHELYAPTGLIGHGFGIVGSLLVIIGVLLYSSRKRVRLLARAGRLSDWLNFHIFLCLLGPYLVVLHTTFKFGGFVAISFWSMVLVVSSGVFGRYVYVWIPKTMSGGFLGVEEMREQLTGILAKVEGQTGLPAEELREILRDPVNAATHVRAQAEQRATAAMGGAAKSIHQLFTGGTRAANHDAASQDRRKAPRSGSDRRGRERHPGLFRAIAESLGHRLTRGRRRAQFGRALTAANVPESIRGRVVEYLEEERRVEQQLRVLHPFQRAFRYWHAFHLPLALVMFGVLGVHVAVAVAFGYTWIFGN